MERSGKESAIRVEAVIKKINSLCVNVYGSEKLEVINEVCKRWDICRDHILKVGEFYFLKNKEDIKRFK